MRLCFLGEPQKLCDLVSELLLEECNVQPVSTPVTVCGDIHGQVGCSYHISADKAISDQI